MQYNNIYKLLDATKNMSDKRRALIGLHHSTTLTQSYIAWCERMSYQADVATNAEEMLEKAKSS